jgi:hypothetical protein
MSDRARHGSPGADVCVVRTVAQDCHRPRDQDHNPAITPSFCCLIDAPLEIFKISLALQENNAWSRAEMAEPYSDAIPY